jgi:ATP-dependent DNA helicase RecQ
VVVKGFERAPQAEMSNSSQQSGNVAGAFEVVGVVPDGPVLLVDDVVNSRWTITTIGARLRKRGSGAVLPVVLARGAGD